MTNKNILVDSGATNNFIHPHLIKQFGLGTNSLNKPRKVWNVNGTTNRGGELTHYVDLDVTFCFGFESVLHFLMCH